MLPPLEVLTARRRLFSRFALARPVVLGWGTESRSCSALRFNGFVASVDFTAPLGRAVFVVPAVVLAGCCFGREICVMRGEEEELEEELF